MSLFRRAVPLLLGLAACSSDSTTAPTGPASSDVQPIMPANWGGSQRLISYRVGRSNRAAHSGNGSVAIFGSDSSSIFAASFSQSFKADQYLGKRVRFRAWVRSENVAARIAGLWMRVDTHGQVIAFDNSSNHSERGTKDWHQVDIILDVPLDAVGISFGGILEGSGLLVIDDATFDVIPATGPTTDQLTDPLEIDNSSFYANLGTAPLNLNFE
jgi:hypothetical protein